MERVIALVVLTALAVAIALILQRRRPDPPTAPSYRSPAQLDMADFTETGNRLLVALFSSATCDTCPKAWDTIEAVIARRADAVSQRLDVEDDPKVHQRYRIDGVPTTVVADRDGVVAQAFFGPITADELVEALDTRGEPPRPEGPRLSDR